MANKYAQKVKNRHTREQKWLISMPSWSKIGILHSKNGSKVCLIVSYLYLSTENAIYGKTKNGYKSSFIKLATIFFL